MFKLVIAICLLFGSISAKDSGVKTAAGSNKRSYFVSNRPSPSNLRKHQQANAQTSASNFYPKYRPSPTAVTDFASNVVTRELPVTSFNCAKQSFIPGIYADVEANCEVYHVCTSHYTYSFACGEGTAFNQAVLTCDYPHNSNFNFSCSNSAQFFSKTAGIGIETGIVTPEVAKTSFKCTDKPFLPGYYADLETDCNTYHVCVGEQQFDFNCAEGTVFSQEKLVCTYKEEVQCESSPQFYSKNAGIGVPLSVFNSAYNQNNN